ncbi:MAG: twin-arginine translocase TatA/TatE family subunit [Planctomycetota bacterium]
MISTLGFLGNLGFTEIVVIVGVLVLLFGAKKIPELARSLGSSIKEFKKGAQEVEKKIEDSPSPEQETTKK